MAEDFRSDDFADMPPTASAPNWEPPDRESVRLIVVGSRRGVVSMIHTLHLRSVANANEWSTLQPEPMTGKWMSVVTKYIQLN